MPAQILVTTSTKGLQPLGTAAQRSFELVTATVRDRLGEAHAGIFAEPLVAERGDQIDWHAPIAGRAERLSALETDQQRAIRDRLSDLAGQIVSLADDLQNSADADDQRLGEALANAVEIPSDDMVYVLYTDLGARPVLVHWGWVQDGTGTVRGVLTKTMPRRDAGLVRSGPVATVWDSAIWWWLILLGWLMLALMLGAILYLTVRPCGLTPWGPSHCPADPVAISAAYSEQAVLQDRVSQVERDIALARRQCQPTIPIGPAEAAPSFPQPAKPEESVPEQKGALPPDPGDALRRLAGLAGSLYSRLNPFASGN